MKKNDIKALHQKDQKELSTMLKEMSLMLAQARLQKKAGKLANVSKIAMLADDIARVKTVLKMKELA